MVGSGIRLFGGVELEVVGAWLERGSDTSVASKTGLSRVAFQIVPMEL